MSFVKLISVVLMVILMIVPLVLGAVRDVSAQTADDENLSIKLSEARSETLTETLPGLLSSKHPVLDVSVLSKAAGGDDLLVAELLELRLKSKPPTLGINAEKVLLNFIERADVKAALHEDVATPARFGLASVVLSRLDQLPDSELRSSLAKTALQMVSGDSVKASAGVSEDIAARINSLIANSSDPSVKALIVR